MVRYDRREIFPRRIFAYEQCRSLLEYPMSKMELQKIFTYNHCAHEHEAFLEYVFTSEGAKLGAL